MSPELERLLAEAKEAFNKMTKEEQKAMYQQQRDGWVKAELQWAKDFRDGKCRYD